MGINEIRAAIEGGRARLGVEFGSTRIKAVLIDEAGTPIAQGAHDWENQLVNNIWTYDLKDVITGLQDCYADMLRDVKAKYGCGVKKLAAMGFSAMMHGYIVFNEKDELLVPFRTWRNTITGEAAEKLTGLFNFNIPQRWSIAHLYQAILNGEPHVPDIRFMTTLEGFVHWKLTGKKVLGIGEGSGMFPIDSATNDFNQEMVDKFTNFEKLAESNPDYNGIAGWVRKMRAGETGHGTYKLAGQHKYLAFTSVHNTPFSVAAQEPANLS